MSYHDTNTPRDYGGWRRRRGIGMFGFGAAGTAAGPAGIAVAGLAAGAASARRKATEAMQPPGTPGGDQ